MTETAAAAGRIGRPSWGRRVEEYLVSEDFRQALRVATAMVVAYYISLSLGWERPQWAGLAVALCSLATTGDSAGKGILRLLGTLAAGTVAILLAAIFPQDRWAYLIVATLYIAVCAYMMPTTSRSYFWFIGGYVMALLAMAGGPEGGTLFEIIVLRLQQTAMGFVVYFVVASLMWPQKAAPVLEAAFSDLLTACRERLRLSADRAAGVAAADADRTDKTLRARTARLRSGLPAAMNGAELDDLEIWFERGRWRRLVSELGELDDALEGLRLDIADLDGLDAATALPGLDATLAEIDGRLAQTLRMLAGEAPEREPSDVPALESDAADARLSPFDRAAVVSIRDRALRLDDVSRRVFQTVAAARGREVQEALAPPSPAAPPSVLDPDRLAAAVRAFLTVWIVLAACLYIPGLPMPPGIVPMAAAAGIMLGLLPALRLGAVLGPGLIATLISWLFHVLVMPQLHGYVGLGAGIFIVIFLAMALLPGPKHAGDRPIITSFFVMVILVNNEQSYNPIFAIDYAIAFCFALGAAWLAGQFPVSFSPQPALRARLRRFFASAARLAPAPGAADERPLRSRWTAFDLREVLTLPTKMRPWAQRQPAVQEGRVPASALGALLDACEILALRLRDLESARAVRQPEALRDALRRDFKEWREAIRDALADLADGPGLPDGPEVGARHAERLADLEKRVEDAMRAAPADALSEEERASMYRLLSAYRGLSDGAALVIEAAAAIDWNELAENRF